MLRYLLLPRVSRLVLLAAIALVTAIAAACGSGTSMRGPVLRGNTTVVLMASSTANDQFSQFIVNFSSLTLTSQSGQNVELLAALQKAEFLHLNGGAEPLVTVSVPQDIYTSASATIQDSRFSCVSLLPTGGIQTSSFGPNGKLTATLTLPSPITVTGTAMGLILNLLMAKSVTTSNCDLSSNPAYSITPTFTVTPVALASPPTNAQNGKMTSLEGLIASVDSMTNGFTVSAGDGPTWSIQSNDTTQFQGVAAFSTLAAGMPVDLDVAIQPDGSLLATRVAVADLNPTNLSITSGPVLFIAASQPSLLSLGQEQQGFLFSGFQFASPIYFNTGSAVYQISRRLANLQTLPFAPVFSAANAFAGQKAAFSSHALGLSGYPPATTITLVPQTINGTITAVGSEGSFTTYTVSLAAYDLIPALAVQPGQTTATTNPSSVVVYVDSNIQQLSTKQLAVGNVFRFNGLLFNDSGTLRLDCGQINDGVPE